MYFSNPPKAPGVEFYTEAFRLLIKYNDRVGVENLYEVMKEEKIPADDKLIDEVQYKPESFSLSLCVCVLLNRLLSCLTS